MKIAVVIAGEPRFSAQLESFIESLHGLESADWFFYLWKQSRTKHLKLQVPPDWENIPSREWSMETIARNLPQPHRVIDVQIGDQDVVPDMYGSQHVLFKQFHSLHQADLLRQQHGPYDLVVRGRVDMSMIHPINLLAIKQAVDQNPNWIFTPSTNRHGGYDLNDQLAISSPENIAKYTDLINHANRYKSQGVPEHPETLMGYHLISSGLDIRREIHAGELRDPNHTEGFGRWG
jgi:hypothetical protein